MNPINSTNEAPSSVASEPVDTTPAAAHAQPVSPLPWKREVIGVAGVNDEATVYNITSQTNGRTVATVADDGPYIVRAVNAYPQLVAVLRYYAIPGMGDNGDRSRALLSELGELK
jgi:hypothetical protein